MWTMWITVVYLCYIGQVSIAPNHHRYFPPMPGPACLALPHWVIDTISIATLCLLYIGHIIHARSKEGTQFDNKDCCCFSPLGVFYCRHMELEMKHWWWRTGLGWSTAAILWPLYSYMRWPWCHNVILTMTRKHIFKGPHQIVGPWFSIFLWSEVGGETIQNILALIRKWEKGQYFGFYFTV